jgi:hypothetical protein
MRENPQEWQASLRSELEALIAIRTFKILKGLPPPRIHPRSYKIILRNKMSIDGIIRWHKSRVVV